MTRSRVRSALRRIHLIFYWRFETPVKKKRVIVTSGAPFAALHARNRLHVLNGFAVELIVEGSEMVSGTIGLVVDVFCGTRSKASSP